MVSPTTLTFSVLVLVLGDRPLRTGIWFYLGALGATLHIEDSLQAGHSRFFAEILRIRTIADAARGPVPLLFLLDEILHGTNSHDRRIGAEALVRGLVARGAIGLITTKNPDGSPKIPDAMGICGYDAARVLIDATDGALAIARYASGDARVALGLDH